jgi:heavy metal sensor kinase
MTRVPIRVRLTAWYAAVLLTGLALFGLGMWFELNERLVAGVDTRLDKRLEGLRAALGAEAEIKDRGQLRQELGEFAKEVPDGTLIQLRGRSGELLQFSPNQTVVPPDQPAGQGSHYTIEVNGKPFRVVTGHLECAGETYDVLVANSLDEVLSVMRVFRNLLYLMIPAVLALASLGGYWLSLRALRPVDEITAVARSISLQNLSKRIAVPPTGDELQRMSETWNEVLGRLDVAVKRIRQFTADASHELRTPLALIRTTAEIALRRDREAAEYRKSLKDIESEVERMTELTESLLTVARADTNGFEVALADTDLSAVVRSVANQNQARAAEKGVRLAAEDGPVAVHATADASAIRRVLLILVDNALKHTPSGGTVTLKAAAAAGGAELSVVDTGEGISAEALPHVFERFYRADPARGAGSGFGLGLSIAQAIAHAHNSEISVKSVPGSGSHFSLILRA